MSSVEGRPEALHVDAAHRSMSEITGHALRNARLRGDADIEGACYDVLTGMRATDPDAVDQIVVSLLADPDPSMRVLGAELIMLADGIDDAEVERRWISVLTDDTREVREGAFTALQEAIEHHPLDDQTQIVRLASAFYRTQAEEAHAEASPGSTG